MNDLDEAENASARAQLDVSVAPVARPRAGAANAGAIFSVRNPPTKRKPPPAPTETTRQGKAKKPKGPKRQSQLTYTPKPTSSTPAADSALERPSRQPRPPDLLDDDVVVDPDELYSENERALSDFIRLHPMLSLDATNSRMLTCVASMVSDFAVKTRDLEVVSKSHDDLFLRPARLEDGERDCVNANKCVCRWIAAFRYGEKTERAFTCREFLLPSENEAWLKDGTLPRNPAKCLICARYYSSYIYTLAKSSPTFCPTRAIQLQAFANSIAVEDPIGEVLTSTAKVGTDDGYRASKMLFVDEKFVESSSAQTELATLLWRPVVRFNCSDYEYVVDDDGEPMIVQVDMGTVGGGLDFGRPPSSAVGRAEASD